MIPVKNITPIYAIIHPIGSKLRWKSSTGEIWPDEVIIITGYRQDCCDCKDCDAIRYVDEEGKANCHYRKEHSSYGLRYWERIDQ
jgi:hypothetical protein